MFYRKKGIIQWATCCAITVFWRNVSGHFRVYNSSTFENFNALRTYIKYILYSKIYSSKYILFGNQCFNKDLNSPFLCMKVRRMLSNIIWFSFTNECSNSCEKFRRNFSRLELKTNGRSSKICYVGYLVCIELQATYLNHVLHDMVFKFLY